jgi:16S rRNA (guanine527-N7)-methyltransferase
LVRPTGAMLAMKGAAVEQEIRDAEPSLRTLGAQPPEVLTLGLGLVDPPTTVLRVVPDASARLGLSRQQRAERDRGRRARGGGL